MSEYGSSELVARVQSSQTDVSKPKFTMHNASETDEHCRIRIGRQTMYESRSIGPVGTHQDDRLASLNERTNESSKQEGKEIEGRLLFGGGKVKACWF